MIRERAHEILGWIFEAANPSAGGYLHLFGKLSIGFLFLTAAVSDYRKGIIPNRLNLFIFIWVLIAFGWTCYFSSDRASLFASALVGYGFVFFVLFPLFVFRALGGGDVKLLFALTPILGGEAIMRVFYNAILVTAISSTALLLLHRRFFLVLREIIRFLRELLTPGMAVRPPDFGGGIQIPFGVSLFIGFLVYSIGRGWF